LLVVGHDGLNIKVGLLLREMRRCRELRHHSLALEHISLAFLHLNVALIGSDLAKALSARNIVELLVALDSGDGAFASSALE